MKTIEENICEAIETIVNKSIKDASFDKTSTATIVQCLDKTSGKYMINYEGNSIVAYTLFPGITYPTNALVNVMASANGSNDKVIVNAITLRNQVQVGENETVVTDTISTVIEKGIFYVDCNLGNDNNLGTVSAPFKSLDKVLELLNNYKSIVCYIMSSGTYEITKTIWSNCILEINSLVSDVKISSDSDIVFSNSIITLKTGYSTDKYIITYKLDADVSDIYKNDLESRFNNWIIETSKEKTFLDTSKISYHWLTFENKIKIYNSTFNADGLVVNNIENYNSYIKLNYVDIFNINSYFSNINLNNLFTYYSSNKYNILSDNSNITLKNNFFAILDDNQNMTAAIKLINNSLLNINSNFSVVYDGYEYFIESQDSKIYKNHYEKELKINDLL